MVAQVEYWSYYYMAEGLMALALIGMWRAARYSSRGLALVGLHFLVMLALLLGFVVSWPLGAPIEASFALWLLFVVPGVGFLAWESAPVFWRSARYLWRKTRWSLAWLVQRRQHQRTLQALADEGFGEVVRWWSPRLRWDTKDNYIDVRFLVKGDQGATVLAYYGHSRIPLDLLLGPLELVKTRLGSMAPLEHVSEQAWLDSFAIPFHWSPFSAMWVTGPRFFGRVAPDLHVAGEEQDVLALFGASIRASLADGFADGSLSVEDGVICVSLPGFLAQERLQEVLFRLMALGGALSIPKEDYPKALLANLQAEADAGLRVRLLEYLLHQHVDTAEAAAAKVWAEEQGDLILRLLCCIVAIKQGAAGSLPAMVALVKDATDTSEMATHLRLCGWKYLHNQEPTEGLLALLSEVMERDDDPLCSELAYDVALHLSHASEAPLVMACWAWAMKLKGPFDSPRGNAILALYRTDIVPHREGDAHVIALMQQPQESLRSEALQLLGLRGGPETIGLLYQVMKATNRADPGAVALQAKIRDTIEQIRVRLGPQEMGQLSLLDEVAGEGGMLSLTAEGQSGSLSLVAEAEAAGALSLDEASGGLSLADDPNEGAVSLVSSEETTSCAGEHER